MWGKVGCGGAVGLYIETTEFLVPIKYYILYA